MSEDSRSCGVAETAFASGWRTRRPIPPADQKHLESASPERAYWHHGYQAALNDVIDLLTASTRKSGSEDIPN